MYIHTVCCFRQLDHVCMCTVEPLYKYIPEDTSVNSSLLSVPNASFVYLTPEMRTPHYSGHFKLLQWCSV